MMSDEAKIIVVTGVQGAGKSTVGRLLGERFERGAHIDADTVQSMIVSGEAWVTDTSAPARGYMTRRPASCDCVCITLVCSRSPFEKPASRLSSATS